MNKGYFITFEGGEACGKSTQIAKLKNLIENSKYKDQFIFVKDPGQSPLGEDIRKILLFTKTQPEVLSELFLYLASRVELVKKIILPALNQGKVVISDRFYDSTVAYQGFARNILPIEEIKHLADLSTCGVKPNSTFYMKLSPKEAFKRKGDMQLDRIELEGDQFHENVKKGYDYLAEHNKERFFVIDASMSIDSIFEEIKTQLNSKLNIKL